MKAASELRSMKNNGNGKRSEPDQEYIIRLDKEKGKTILSGMKLLEKDREDWLW